MKKRGLKRLCLNSETLRRLDQLEMHGAIVGAGPTVASACKMASDCVDCTTTDDPDLCVASWAGNCYTLTCQGC
jgi:hypothetical protein